VPASPTRRGLRTRDRRTLAAFAEALIPDGGADVPGAGPDGVDAAAGVSAFAGAIPRRQRLVVVLVLRAIEWLSGARPFSALDLDARTRRLERLAGNPLGRDLVLLLKALVSFGWARDERVQRALEVRPRCELAAGAALPDAGAAPLEREALRVAEPRERCDVVIVGSGAGGASVARALAERGVDVIVLEEGALHDASTYTTDPLAALSQLYRDGGLTVLEGRPAIPMPVGRCVGGTTVINSGTCVRTPPELLARWRDEHGIGWAPELEAEFDAIERDLAVTRLDRAVAGGNADVCRRGAEALGAANRPVARNAGAVVCCGTCPTGCALDAKQAMHVSELPRALAAGARLRADVRVERVLLRGGRAAGVLAVADGDGRTYEVDAGAVVLAGGALGTPELLLRQRLGRAAVGRGLHVQPACWVGALFDDEVRGFDGVMQSWHVDEWRPQRLFLEATFTPLPFGAHWLPGVGLDFKRRVAEIGRLAVIGVHLADRSEGRVRVAARGRGATRLGYRLTREDAETLRFGIARAADILFAAGAREVYPQVAGWSVLRPGEQTRFEHEPIRPAQLRLEAFHPMGTARLGGDASGAPVAPDGSLRGVPGLYVADGSLLPTALGVNPMITIIAVARRIARDLAERLA
jgi:choline dehydrogenase-like flavoprotein